MNIPSIIVLLIIGIAFIFAIHSIIKMVVVIAGVVIYVIINVIDM